MFIMGFNEEKKYLLKNPPKEVKSGSWVERTATYGNRTVTRGKKYRVKNYFKYLNSYGEKGEKYPAWDEFITIKNDDGWTVKMNLIGFTTCDAPLTEIQELEKRITELEELCGIR
jgi:hypothetical protein